MNILTRTINILSGLCIGTGPDPAGPALAGPLLGELTNNLDLYYVAYKKGLPWSTVNEST